MASHAPPATSHHFQHDFHIIFEPGTEYSGLLVAWNLFPALETLESGILAFNLFLCREAAKTAKKAKKEQEAADKKRKNAESKAAAKAARPKGPGGGRRRKKGNGNDTDDDVAEEGKKKKPRTRHQGEFNDSDPALIRTGASLPEIYKVQVTDHFSCFVETILKGEACVIRCRKGGVRKVLSKSLDLKEEAKDWVNQSSKGMGMKQANIADELRKLNGDIRRNVSFMEKDPLPSLLGLDALLMAGMKATTAGSDESGSERCEGAWLFDRNKLQKELVSASPLGCIACRTAEKPFVQFRSINFLSFSLSLSVSSFLPSCGSGPWPGHLG